MREVVRLYGKTYHFWQVGRGNQLTLRQPELIMNFTKDGQVRDNLILSLPFHLLASFFLSCLYDRWYCDWPT